jgi:hypothetical protein
MWYSLPSLFISLVQAVALGVRLFQHAEEARSQRLLPHVVRRREQLVGGGCGDGDLRQSASLLVGKTHSKQMGGMGQRLAHARMAPFGCLFGSTG